MWQSGKELAGSPDTEVAPLTILLFGQFIFIEHLPCDDLILPHGASPGGDGENGEINITQLEVGQ